MDECNEPSVNFFEEVKKLKDLVKHLELQNQILRGNQKHTSDVYNSKTYDSLVDNGHLNNNNDNSSILRDTSAKTKEEENYFDEIDIIKFSDIDYSDDDSWLYSSPIALTPEQKKESPYQWLRKDVDDPENKELQLAKTALIKKLNDLDKSQERKCLIFDTRTFTKTRKRQALDYLASISPRVWSDKGSNESSFVSRDSDVSLDSSSGIFTLTDASDVQEVARMQEESLRMNSPLCPTNRADDFAQITASPNVLQKSNDSLRSSPSDSPYSSNMSLNNDHGEKKNACRRSLPNLNEGPRTQPMMPRQNKNNQRLHSASKLANSGRSFSNLVPAPKKVKERVLMQPKTQSQLPPKSGLPRPSNLGKPKSASRNW